MRAHLAAAPIPYTGRELRSHWILDTFGIQGDAIVAFCGPCEVELEAMVDLADVAAGQGIRSRLMLHFIAESFDTDLGKAVLRQRLLVALARELLLHEADVRREGDDLYVAARKLSVSIATASPISTLIHLGINIDPEGAPVAAIGLEELGVDARELAGALLRAFVQELHGVQQARCKVRPVP